MLLSLPIDPDLWDQANWHGTVFMRPQEDDRPSILGLGFTNECAARRIFQDWRKRYGRQDRFEELRVFIIEGEMPGRPPGYSVHVGADPRNVFRRYQKLGLMADGDLLAITSRINRMNAPSSSNLAAFKEAYERFKAYFLAPALVDDGGTRVLKKMLDLSILKRTIYFRRASEIGNNDPDTVVLPKS
jgi:hypothetical protein